MTPKEQRYRDAIAEHERGASIAVLARRLGVKPSTLVWWRYELKRRDRSRAEPGPLLPVRVAQPSAPSSPRDFELALPGGVQLRIPAGFDPCDFDRQRSPPWSERGRSCDIYGVFAARRFLSAVPRFAAMTASSRLD